MLRNDPDIRVAMPDDGTSTSIATFCVLDYEQAETNADTLLIIDK